MISIYNIHLPYTLTNDEDIWHPCRFSPIKHLMDQLLTFRFSCGFCSRIGFGENIERAEQRRSRHLGPSLETSFYGVCVCVFLWDLLPEDYIAWNIIMEVWKIIFFSKWLICRFHVNLLPGCIDDWVALMEDGLGFGGCFVFFYTPPRTEKRKDQWRWWGNMFYFKMYFLKGSQILRGIWAGFFCFQLNRVRHQMQELRPENILVKQHICLFQPSSTVHDSDKVHHGHQGLSQFFMCLSRGMCFMDLLPSGPN